MDQIRSIFTISQVTHLNTITRKINESGFLLVLAASAKLYSVFQKK
jgi:hypothetical protein